MQEHQGWRLLTCIWLHAGVAHLLANMISLVLIGLRLEQQFGYGMHSCRNLTPPGLSRTMSDLDLHSRFLTVRIGIIYLVSGVGGSVLSSLPSLSALLELCSDSLVPCCPSSSPTGPFTQTRCRSSLLALRCKSFGRKCGFRTKLHSLTQVM